MATELPGEIVRRIRKRKKLSQQKVAEQCGLQRAYISQIEQRRIKSITLDTARALAKGLGVRPEVFLTTADAEPLYMSEHIFAGILRDLRERYDFPDPGDNSERRP